MATSQNTVVPPLPSTISQPAGQAEQVGQPGPDRADEPLHGFLAVGRPEDDRAGGEQLVELLGAHLRRAAAEATVGGQQLGW